MIAVREASEPGREPRGRDVLLNRNVIQGLPLHDVLAGASRHALSALDTEDNGRTLAATRAVVVSMHTLLQRRTHGIMRAVECSGNTDRMTRAHFLFATRGPGSTEYSYMRGRRWVPRAASRRWGALQNLTLPSPRKVRGEGKVRCDRGDQTGALRLRLAILAARLRALRALRCLAWMALRRASDMLGMEFLS